MPIYIHLSTSTFTCMQTCLMSTYASGPRGLIFAWWGCCSLCIWHKPSELAHSLLFCSRVYFCLYGSFNCSSSPEFSRQLSAFSILRRSSANPKSLVWRMGCRVFRPRDHFFTEGVDLKNVVGVCSTEPHLSFAASASPVGFFHSVSFFLFTFF